MKILNLVNQDKSDIKYKISKFPDGQQNITIDMNNLASCYGYPIQIKSRLNNWLDLELIVCATKALRELDITEIHLYTPYFLGARSDRKFEEGGNWYLKDVICPIINSLDFKSVTVLDPHSYVLGNLLNNFKQESNLTLVSSALEELYVGPVNWDIKKSSRIHVSPRDSNKFILISPDAGASHKINKLAEQINYTGDIITCSKERDAEGKLTQVTFPATTSIACNQDWIIVDDICDGGRTFINIAKVIKDRSYKGKIYLIVTHGIFSAGFDELEKHFDGIYCTNSYKDLNGFAIGSTKVMMIDKFVKQLNVF
jgi:ribose-phosphate pyrophosphokinase